MQRLLSISAAALAAVLAGCGGGAENPTKVAAPEASVSISPLADAGGPPAASAAAPAKSGAPSGELDCRLFDTPAEAFAAVLAEHQPLVLAVGEAHAQKDSRVASATKRFTETLLPLLQPRATDLVVELLLPAAGCKKTVAQVAEKQKEVTKQQAGSNQNEFVTLGHRSKALGITPHVLRPTCEEYDKIVQAGSDGIMEMLAMIAKLTEAKAKQLLAQNRAKGPDKQLVVAYGGAMHNDLQPRQDREQWSFGPQLSAATDGRYVAIDLIVPEFIQPTQSWQSLPWYEHFDPDRNPDKVTLLRPAPSSYVLIFARSKPVDEAPAAPSPKKGK